MKEFCEIDNIDGRVEKGVEKGQNSRKNVLSSTIKNRMQRLITWINRHGPGIGCPMR